MIELRVNSNNLLIDDVYIENENNIAILNKQTFYKFIYCFYDLFIERNSNNKIYFGNKIIDTRTTIFINLSDFYSLFNQMTFKKGNMIYDSILNKISQYYTNNDLNLDEILNSELNESKVKTGFDYTIDFEIDIQKLLSSFGNVQVNIDLDNIEEAIFKMVRELINLNPSKIFIIFQDKDLIKADLNFNENVYTFIINNDKYPNLIVSNNIRNFDRSLLLSHVKLSWPISIKTNEINTIVDEFTKEIIIDKKKKTSNYNVYILNNIFCKLNNINNEITLENTNNDIPYEIQEYILSIENNKI